MCERLVTSLSPGACWDRLQPHWPCTGQAEGLDRLWPTWLIYNAFTLKNFKGASAHICIVIWCMSFVRVCVLACSAAGGEIFNQCVSDREDEAFSEDDVKRLMRQILEGVSFLHQNNVVHLDLKVSGRTQTRLSITIFTLHFLYSPFISTLISSWCLKLWRANMWQSILCLA